MSDEGGMTPIAHNEKDNKNFVRLATMWQQSGTLLFDSCHEIAGLLHEDEFKD